jgi:hypothetical protein
LGCKPLPNKEEKQNEKDFHDVGKGFYRGPDGRLYVRTEALIDPPEKFSDPFFAEVPDIDLPTFQEYGLSEYYAKDKNHVYVDFAMSDGRHLWILDSADAKTFVEIGYRMGKDKNHVFSDGMILEGLKPDSLILLSPVVTQYNQVFIHAMKDNDQVFIGDNEMKGVDVASFKCIVLPYDSTKHYCEKNMEGDSMRLYRDKDWIYDVNAFDYNEEVKRIKN